MEKRWWDDSLTCREAGDTTECVTSRGQVQRGFGRAAASRITP
jgi:hypothetical protein